MFWIVLVWFGWQIAQLHLNHGVCKESPTCPIWVQDLHLSDFVPKSKIIRRAPQARACENFFQYVFHSSSSNLQARAPLPSILHSSSSRSGCLQNLRNLYIGESIRAAQAATGRHRGLDFLALETSKINENQWKSMKINEIPGLGPSRHPNLIIRRVLDASNIDFLFLELGGRGGSL